MRAMDLFNPQTWDSLIICVSWQYTPLIFGTHPEAHLFEMSLKIHNICFTLVYIIMLWTKVHTVQIRNKQPQKHTLNYQYIS